MSPYLDLNGFHRTLKLHPHRKRFVVISEVNRSRVNWNYSKEGHYIYRERAKGMSVLLGFFC